MKTLLSILATVSLLACNNTPDATDGEAANTDATEASDGINYYGDEISEEGAVPAEGLLAQLGDHDSLNIKLVTTILETCSKKGCWMNVDIGNKEKMMVRFKDYGFFVPISGVDGKTAIIEGTLFNDTVSVETLRHYADDAGKDSTEIMAITEPSTELAFEATGVIIKD